MNALGRRRNADHASAREDEFFRARVAVAQTRGASPDGSPAGVHPEKRRSRQAPRRNDPPRVLLGVAPLPAARAIGSTARASTAGGRLLPRRRAVAARPFA